MVLGVFYQFIEPNADKLLTFYFLIGILACTLYMAFIPESPFWLIENEGENSQKAIENLNYIAMLNGSSYRIPTDTLITLNQTNEDNLPNSDMESVNKKHKNGLSHVFKSFNLLIFSREKLMTHLRMMILFMIASVLYMLCVLNS